MKRAVQLTEIFSENYTKPISEKYAKVILQVATLEERIKSFLDFGMVERSQELSDGLIALLEEIKKEYLKDTEDEE